MKSKNSKTLVSFKLRNSVFGKPPPIETLISGKFVLMNCAQRKALYKFPGKGTDIRTSLGCTCWIFSSNIESVILSIYVVSFCNSAYNSSNEFALLPNRSA